MIFNPFKFGNSLNPIISAATENFEISLAFSSSRSKDYRVLKSTNAFLKFYKELSPTSGPRGNKASQFSSW